MSHEPGRNRFISYCCEHCGRHQRDELIEHPFNGELWCGDCIDNEIQDEAEADYERQQERDLESPPESAREEQLRTWEEHQKAHKR